MNTRIMWAQDLHLKPSIQFRGRTIYGDSADALFQIAAICAERRPGALILGGDLYDTPRPEAYSLNAFAAFVDAVRSYGTEVYAIQGNHDRTSSISELNVGETKAPALFEADGVLSLDGRLLEISGARVYGMEYCSIAKAQERMAAVPECDILCMHHRFRHMLGFDEVYHYDLADVSPNVRKYVLCGDVHVPDNREIAPGVRFISTSSTWVTRQGEQLKKHCVCEIDTADWKCVFTALRTRQYIDVSKEKDDWQEQAVEAVLKQNEQCTLPPVITTTDWHGMTKKYGDKAIFVEPVRVQVQAEQPDDTEQDATPEMTLPQAIGAYYAKKGDTETAGFLQDLVSSPDSAARLEEKLNQIV